MLLFLLMSFFVAVFVHGYFEVYVDFGVDVDIVFGMGVDVDVDVNVDIVVLGAVDFVV